LAGELIDISATLSTNMVHWPGDPPVLLQLSEDTDDGGTVRISQMHLSCHTGTHMDAPLHYLEGAPGLDEMPLTATIGLCRVAEVRDPESVKADELTRIDPKAGERLLLKTRNSRRRWESEPFDESFVHLRADAAELLAERRIRTLGVDYLSVGSFHDGGAETHRALLRAGIWIIEGLNLGAVAPGDYELICLPLLVLGSDGAPARAVLRAL